MIAQSVAELIASEKKELKVLFASLNGRGNTEYIRETPVYIDELKNHIDNKMLNRQDFLRICKRTDNLYMMAGISNEIEERLYFPDAAGYLLQTVTPEVDIVIVDSGNAIDNGLAIGALSAANDVFLVLTQQESVLKRFERLKDIYQSLGLPITEFLINKYYAEDPYSLDYIGQRLQLEKKTFSKIESAENAWQAEMNYKTLIEFKNDKYIQDITGVANGILIKSGYSGIQRQRKSRWKNFI